MTCNRLYQHNEPPTAVRILDEFLAQFSEAQEIHIIGPMPLSPQAQLPLSTEIPVIAVDGGIHHILLPSPHNVLHVGDGDSSNEKPTLLLAPNKDYSDLAFVLQHLPPVYMVSLSGFLAGRKDHELFNFGTVHHYLKHQRHTYCHFEQQIYAFSAGSWQLSLSGIFSLASFCNNEISITGAVEYPCASPRTFQALDSLGLSNIGHGQCQLTMTGPGFIFLTPKSRLQLNATHH